MFSYRKPRLVRVLGQAHEGPGLQGGQGIPKGKVNPQKLISRLYLVFLSELLENMKHSLHGCSTCSQAALNDAH